MYRKSSMKIECYVVFTNLKLTEPKNLFLLMGQSLISSRWSHHVTINIIFQNQFVAVPTNISVVKSHDYTVCTSPSPCECKYTNAYDRHVLWLWIYTFDLVCGRIVKNISQQMIQLVVLMHLTTANWSWITTISASYLLVRIQFVRLYFCRISYSTKQEISVGVD